MVKEVGKKGKIRRSLSYAREAAKKFRIEFRKQMTTAIAAALGFLIALSWREPLSDLTGLAISKLGIAGNEILFKFVAAIVVTFILVLFLIILTRWNVQEEQKPN